ncbi:class I SAM-dependent methyltransferase [Fictibacillus sp. B-59209]|uniref:class I SAM-dependent methyltransferase n=1 Tax=Fictibacillus sp. B-59209 TaxID=3024873 RepID=UPI002E1DFC83|nr:class I SAM-dependent methyltransferase [Fictibacillus sp. B-59209]
MTNLSTKQADCTIPSMINVEEQSDWYKTYFGKDYWELVEYSCSTIEVTEQELDFLRPLFDKHNVKKVLDLCCGVGRHSNRLAEENFLVTAVDINDETLKLAEKENPQFNKVNYKLDDIRTVDLKTEEYNAALLMQTSFGYFSNSENIDLIKKINSLLAEEGLLIIDIPNRDGMIKNFSDNGWTKINDKYYLVSHQYDYLDNRRITTMKVLDSQGENSYYNSIQMYSLAEIKFLLESNGFKVISLFGDFSKEHLRFDNNYRRLQVVAQKVKR